MKETISVSPVTRIEGHLGVKVTLENGRVAEARVAGEMYRGFEQILRGRDPLDAQQITQRICGVCPVEHGVASILAQEAVYGIEPAANGRVLRNLIQAANFITSHLTHFYLLSGLDFVDVAQVTGYAGRDPALAALRDWARSELAHNAVNAVGPFLPQFPAQLIRDPELNLGILRHYLTAIEMRQAGHKMGAIFAGKMPHAAALVPGGVTETVTALKIASYRAHLGRLATFIDEVYLPDVLAVAQAFPDYFALGRGAGDLLAFGVFPEEGRADACFLRGGAIIDGRLEPVNVGAISEDVLHSWYSSSSGRAPAQGETTPSPDKPGAYSWLKAPRYGGRPMEVGPLARLMVAHRDGRVPAVRTAVDEWVRKLGRPLADWNSVLGRHLARALEAKLLAARAAEWLEQLQPDRPATVGFTVPETGRGVGLTEAARGALGHWIEVRDRRIANYQCVVPTTWNCSPRDDRGRPGPMEAALAGTAVADPRQPIEVARVIRSYDPCLACAVH